MHPAVPPQFNVAVAPQRTTPAGPGAREAYTIIALRERQPTLCPDNGGQLRAGLVGPWAVHLPAQG
jgi:hypothetical protein